VGADVIWLLNFGIAIDQLLNVILLGSPDETLSSRAYRADRDDKVFGKLFRPAIDALFFWQDRHCYQAYLSEIHRRQYSSNFR
jgi:hypothetical protein